MNIIIGGGITGISAGLATKKRVYESNVIPGGICASYYIGQDGKRQYSRINNEESYRFELGGGHWIFGLNKEVSSFINSFSKIKTYKRISSVYFPDMDLYVPYPIQNHLSYLPKEIKEKSLEEIIKGKNYNVSTISEWLEVNFGKTLCDLFFFPFHELYTANLYNSIAPQDRFKTPIDKEIIKKGAYGKTEAVGYNSTFAYPQNGLDLLIKNMAGKSDVDYNKMLERVDVKSREIFFSDGTSLRYKKLVSTLPLTKMVELAGLYIEEKIPPYTSVLVFNIGADKGNKCPDDHWLYIPNSKTGFHRVGFYSNVDSSFLPVSSRKNNDKVSIYVEQAFLPKDKPSQAEIKEFSRKVIDELKSWSFIGKVDVIDTTWVEYAYTWQYPDSGWVDKALELLKTYDIYQTGRYGKWKFQGIAESIKDGIDIEKIIGTEFKNSPRPGV